MVQHEEIIINESITVYGGDYNSLYLYICCVYNVS